MIPAGGDKSKRIRLVRNFVDIVAMNTFSFAIAIPLELGSAHLSVQSFIRVRAIALVTNTLTGRPYGVWRDYVVRNLCAQGRGRTRIYIADMLAFGAFQLPVYCVNLVIGGHATLSQIMRTALPVTLLAGVIGGPYGLYLEWLRRLCRISAPQQEVESPR
jgi:hypothetical protein